MTRCSSGPTSPKTTTTVSGTPSRLTAARRVTARLSAAFRSRLLAGCADVHELVHRHQLDRGHTEALQVADYGWVGQPGVGMTPARPRTWTS
jgi:hypothetical protein